MQDARLDDRDRAIKHDADQGEQHDRVEHHRGVGLAFAEGNEIAEPSVAADQFADRDADHREGRADAQARHQRRH